MQGASSIPCHSLGMSGAHVYVDALVYMDNATEDATCLVHVTWLHTS